MKILRKTLSAAAVATMAAKGAQASDTRQEQVLETVRPGIYYHLTPHAAKALKVDVAYLVEAIQLQKSQQLAFQLQEDGELNLSIYDSGVFVEVRKDIIKQAIRQ